MEEKKIVRRDKKDITDNREKQKKILLGIGIALFAVLYVFLLTIDTDKGDAVEEGTQSQEISQGEAPAAEEQPDKNALEAKPVDGGTINLSVSRFSSVNPLENRE